MSLLRSLFRLLCKNATSCLPVNFLNVCILPFVTVHLHISVCARILISGLLKVLGPLLNG